MAIPSAEACQRIHFQLIARELQAVEHRAAHQPKLLCQTNPTSGHHSLCFDIEQNIKRAVWPQKHNCEAHPAASKNIHSACVRAAGTRRIVPMLQARFRSVVRSLQKTLQDDKNDIYIAKQGRHVQKACTIKHTPERISGTE